MTRNSECENIFLWYVWRRNIFDSSVGQMEPITVLSFQIFLCFKDAAPSAPWEQIWHVSDHWSLKFSYIFQGQCISQSKKKQKQTQKKQTELLCSNEANLCPTHRQKRRVEKRQRYYVLKYNQSSSFQPPLQNPPEIHPNCVNLCWMQISHQTQISVIVSWWPLD